MKFLTSIFIQAGRNLQKTWASQLMTLVTVGLSVLIFSFFFLVYSNMMQAGDKFGDDLRLIIYLDEEPVAEMQAQLKKKITDFSPVENIVFTSRKQAFKRLADQLGDDRDVLTDLSDDFLPPSIEVYPRKDLKNLTQIERFSKYLATLPGAIKVQYGQDWIKRFQYFTKLLRIIVILSGGLLIMTTTFMVAYTIRLAILARQAELEILRLLGATNNYIQGPFLLEGIFQGLLGSGCGLLALFGLFLWTKENFSAPGFLNFFEFSFFPPGTIVIIMVASVLLCSCGIITSMRRFLRI
jgi:cell division transport system permease protein